MNVIEIRSIFQESFFGKEEILRAYGDLFYFNNSIYESVPLTEEEALFCKQNGYALLYAPQNKNGSNISIHDLNQAFLLKNKKPLLFELDDEYKWYNKNKDSFIFIEGLSPGWFLYKISIIEGSDFSLYSKQEELLNAERASLEVFLGKQIAQENNRITVRPLVIDEIFYQGLASVTCKDFDLTRYVWTRTQFEHEYVRVGRYSEEGMEMTKRDIYDGNSMTGTGLILKL